MQEKRSDERDEAGDRGGGSCAGAPFRQTGGMQRLMRRSCCLESETAAEAVVVGGRRIKRPPPSPSHHTAAAAKLAGSGRLVGALGVWVRHCFVANALPWMSLYHPSMAEFDEEVKYFVFLSILNSCRCFMTRINN